MYVAVPRIIDVSFIVAVVPVATWVSFLYNVRVEEESPVVLSQPVCVPVPYVTEDNGPIDIVGDALVMFTGSNKADRV